jgi:Tfp pilus assembly protein PilF
MLGCVAAPSIEDAQLADEYRINRDKGLAYLNRDNPKMALPALRKAWTFNPKDVEVLVALGLTYDKLGRYARSMDMLQKAESFQPDDGEIANNLGVAHMRLDQLDEAEKYFKKAPHDLKYEHPEESYYNLALLYQRQGREQDMLDALERALQYNNAFMRAHLELANYYQSKWRHVQEREHLMAALEVQSDNIELLERLADSHLRSGATVDAQRFLAKIVAIAPTSDIGKRASKRLTLLRR